MADDFREIRSDLGSRIAQILAAGGTKLDALRQHVDTVLPGFEVVGVPPPHSQFWIVGKPRVLDIG